MNRLLDLETQEERDERLQRKPVQQKLMNLILQRAASLDERCFSCRFFKLSNRKGDGICRLNPPQATTRTTKYNIYDEAKITTSWEQPPTVEKEFCGQHQFRKVLK